MMFHILDDRPELLEMLQELIEMEGYQVMAFDSGEAYLKYFYSQAFVAPIAILSDYEMGGISGLEVIKKVRETLPYQKAVIISGTPSPELDQTMHTYLCNFLPKPYQPNDLFSLLEALNTCENGCNIEQEGGPKQCNHGIQHDCPFHRKHGS